MFGKKDREQTAKTAAQTSEPTLATAPDPAAAAETAATENPAAPAPAEEPAAPHVAERQHQDTANQRQERQSMQSQGTNDLFSIKARGSEELKNESFNEVSAPGMKAYGISVESKNGRYTQILEMLAFCRDAHIAGVNQFIKSVSYSADVCAVEFIQGDMAGTSVALITKLIGRERLTKFSVLGQVESGLARPCDGK